MNKIIVLVGSILLVTGFLILSLSVPEAYLETSTVRKWGVTPHTLEPQESTFYASSMSPERWFQLNISSSSSTKVTVSFIRHLPEPQKIPFFEETGTSFDQKVSTSTGTFVIDIENENPFPVTLQGNVLVQESKETHRIVHPYVIPGFLVVLVGVSTLVFGAFRRSK